MIHWSVIFACVFTTCSKLCQATLAFDFDEDFRECGNGKPLPAVDISNFEIISQPDGSLTMNGTFRFTKDYRNPTRWDFYTKRLERGEWVTGMVSRDIPNLCPVLQMPYEFWYPYTRVMSQKSCPFKAGHEEHLNNVNIGNIATTFKVPPEFLGEWQVYHAITTTRNGKPADECFMIPLTISEV